MNDGSVNEDKAIFKRPSKSMQQHLKPLYIKAKVEGVWVHKVLIDCGACINVMSYSLLKGIGKYDTNLKSNNMALSNYERKTSRPLGVIQVDMVVGTTTRPTLFVVNPNKQNYNLLLGREWLHGVGCVPSSTHQRITIWKPNEIFEYIEADQIFFHVEVNHIEKRNFD